MYRMAIVFISLFVFALSGWNAQPIAVAGTTESGAVLTQLGDRRTPLFDNLGEHHHPISTRVELTQRYFDQGLIFAYGFNHAEAERSFREAAQLDPDCAMCYWGVAWVLGSNINAAMSDEAVPAAWEAIQKAIALSENASENEKAYIQALAKRYSRNPLADRRAIDMAYADAMREVRDRYPEDLDAATLYAEALMDITPWNYWTQDGELRPETRELLATLESVLERNPNHPGANHIYIHAVEASPHPEWGLASADRLRNLVPGAGHLVHMPSHIYIRVGKYHEGSLANERAIAADRSFLARDRNETIYCLGYIPHNVHFLSTTASMEGRSAVAIAAARKMAAQVDREKMREPGWGTLQHYYSIPLYALIRFGKWEEILREPAPSAELKYPTGLWHYARTLAFTGKGQLQAAQGELQQLQAIAADPTLEAVTIWDINSTVNLLQIASEVAIGELAAKQGDYEKAIAHLETAVTLEDGLHYDEPPVWYSPVRQSLGAVLLEADRPAAAQKVYEEDLKRYPENGWSLFGLAQSLQAQDQIEAAQQVQQRFEEAWKYADVRLTASRF